MNKYEVKEVAEIDELDEEWELAMDRLELKGHSTADMDWEEQRRDENERDDRLAMDAGNACQFCASPVHLAERIEDCRSITEVMDEEEANE